MMGKIAPQGAANALPRAETPAECWAWLQREDLTRLAVFAYEMARRDCLPPAGREFMEAGEPWSDRQTFLDGLLDNFMLLLGRHAEALGVAAPRRYDGVRLQMVLADYRAREAQQCHVQR